jgi:hypothetical protein
MTDEHTGSCNCKGVRFRTRGPLRELSACHCTQCRKQTGLHYVATNVTLDRITIEGADEITWYNASTFAQRGFCRICGSALFWRRNGADNISIVAGAFDTPTNLRIAYHIYCADKADFYDIDDGQPQFSQGKPGLATATQPN